VNLFAAFDTRSGHVSATVASRKRQVEFIAFLKRLNREIAGKVRTIHVVLANESRAERKTGSGVDCRAAALSATCSSDPLFVDESG